MMPKWKLISIKLRILKRDNYTCQYCQKRLVVKQKSQHYVKIHKKLTVDHIMPRSKGGTWKDDNLVACCLDCNRNKADKIMIGKAKKAIAIGDKVYESDLELFEAVDKSRSNEEGSISGPMNHAFYMRVGDEFHCLRCHKNLPTANDGTLKHVLECEKIHPTTTYCDKSCGTNLFKNCHKCFKLLVPFEGSEHTFYCPCSPDRFLSIG